MQRLLPFLSWLPNYKKSDLPKDVLAGLTVGIVLVPQAMAYAMIAGLPPVYGLYAALFPVLVYALLGTSRQVGMGPVAMDSLLVAAGLGTLTLAGIEEYIAMAIVLGFLVGAIQLLLGICRMGFLVNFLSRPVISGFTSGAALIIVFSQIRHLLGVDIEKSSQLHQLAINAFHKLGNTNFYDLGIGLAGIVVIVLLKKWDKRIPGILLVVLFGVLAVYFFDLQQYGVEIVGTVPSGLPELKMPDIKMQSVTDLWPIALVLAMVGYLETISIGKAIEEKNNTDHIKANQELVALGSANMIGAFFQSYVATASFSRSAINDDAGARTPLAAIVSVMLVVATLLYLTPLFHFLPNAVLASIIMVSVVKLINLSYPRTLWKHRKDEFTVWGVTFLITLFVGIPEGILLGVLLSLLVMVYRNSKPHFAVLGNIKNSDYYKNVKRFGDEAVLRPDLLIVRFDAQLYFGNTNYFKKQLWKYVEHKGPHLKAIILNAEAINYVDATGAQTLINVIDELHGRGLHFYIAGAIGPIRDIFYRSGIIDCLGEECLFVKIKEAVAHFDDPRRCGSEIEQKVAHENRAR